MQSAKIVFIGGGNMARALIGGLRVSAGEGLSITVSDPNTDQRQQLEQQFGVAGTDDNIAAIDGAQIIVLAVKPQILADVARQLASHVQPDQLVVSVAAGVTTQALGNWLGGHRALVRAMPNTPAMIGCGATGLYAPAAVSAELRSEAESLMRAVGIVQWVEDESLIDSITALSGSGPAYVFLVMEAMQAAAEKLGLDEKAARLLTLETVFGAARLAMESNDAPAVLRSRVTSPGGTTERGIKVLEEAGVREAFGKALAAARNRSIELAAQLEKN